MKTTFLLIALVFGMGLSAQTDIDIQHLLEDAVEEIRDYPIGTIPEDDFFYWTPDAKPRLYDAERKNDTLYLYYKDTRIVTNGCLVMNCTADHSPPVIKYRIPFYVEKGKIVKGKKQHPKHVEVKREVIEYKEQW